MKSQFMMLVLILVLLVACSPKVTVTSEVTVTLTPFPLPTETPIFTPTEVSLESLSVEELVQKYLAGEINDVSFLNFEERKVFSIALDEAEDRLRGANPIIFTDRNGDKFYVDPVTLDFKPVGDGTTPEQQTIDNRIPRVIDDQGYIHVFYNNQWIKIEGSQNIQFNFENFNWPDTEIIDPQWVANPDLLGLTIPEYNYIAGKGKYIMTPLFCLNKEVGEIHIPGWGLSGTLLCYVINENNPFSVTTITMTGAPSLYGDNLKADSSYTIMEGTNFIKKLQIATLYYMMYETDQKNEFATTYPRSNGQEVTADYQGLVPSHQTHDVITGKINSDKLSLIQVTSLVQEGQ